MEVTNQSTDIRFDVPLYTVAEAARVLAVPTSTLANWTLGYTRHRPESNNIVGRPVVTAFNALKGQPSIPFVGLAEAMVLAAVRKAGVPLQRVRPALEILSREIGVDHVLASRKLFTDGAELLYDYSSKAPTGEADAVRELVVVRSQQHVFTGVLLDYLTRITYGKDGFASRIKLPAFEYAEVIADPYRSFGQPIFVHGAARVSDVLEPFWSGEDIDSLVMEFGVSESDIEYVLRAASRQAA